MPPISVLQNNTATRGRNQHQQQGLATNGNPPTDDEGLLSPTTSLERLLNDPTGLELLTTSSTPLDQWRAETVVPQQGPLMGLLQHTAASLMPTAPGNLSPGDLTGLSDTQKQDVFKNMAQSLDGAQLARLSEAFGGSALGTNDDVTAIGQAIADYATPDTKAGFVEAMAGRGLIVAGEQTDNGFFGAVTVTRQSSVYTDSALAVLGSMTGEAPSFDRAIAALDNDQLTTLVQGGLGATTNDPAVGFTSTEYRADALVQLQKVAETTGSIETRVRVLSEVNTGIDTLATKDKDAAVLSGGGNLEKSIVPSIPPSAAEVAATRAELAQQRTRIDDLRAVGTPEATALADELQTRYHGAQMAKLSADVYHWEGKGVHLSAPVGWTRASEDPASLAIYGIKPDALAPDASGFRAELYIPDPVIHGPAAQPVLTFKGTTATSVEDWSNNFGQATGNRTDYYDRAMSLAVLVNRDRNGKFELTGHSLGGGMASAASAVTGAETTTYNSAGLHANTASEFIARTGLGTPVADTSQSVTVYQVEGEILTTLQSSGSGIDPQRAEQVADVVGFAAGVASNPFVKGKLDDSVGPVGDWGMLASAQGSDVLNMAEAVGEPVALNALDSNNLAPVQNALELVGPNGVATRADEILDRMDEKLAVIDDIPWYVPPQIKISRSLYIQGKAYSEAYAEMKADPMLTGAGSALSESAARHGMDYVNRGINQVLDGLESQAGTLLGR